MQLKNSIVFYPSSNDDFTFFFFLSMYNSLIDTLIFVVQIPLYIV